MLTNSEPTFISNSPLEHKAMDFEYLRREGIKYIQRLGGKIWTDHNTHDPGITILDQLCYAITDLSYRINNDMKDLLADEDGNEYKSLFTPAEILTVNPVTALDIRKVVLDVDGVKNAWVEKVTYSKPEIYYDSISRSLHLADEGDSFEALEIAGLYRVLIEQNIFSVHASQVVANVAKRLNACRNLCEDFAEIKVLATQAITVSGSIEVGRVEDLNKFAADMLYRVAVFISPNIKFYTLDELLDKGRSTDEIFEGPVLKHGFIDDGELTKVERRRELYTSDIIRELMDEPEVIAVNQVAVTVGLPEATGAEQANVKTAQNWRLVLDPEQVPKLHLDNSLKSIKFLKNGTELTVDSSAVSNFFDELTNAGLSSSLNENERNVLPQPGTYRNLSNYYSLQNHFPQVYGIGEVGLPDSAPAKRVAQSKQLKAYLMFFEQILANYFQQLGAVKSLFSFYYDDESENKFSSYYTKAIARVVPGACELIESCVEHEKKLGKEDEKFNEHELNLNRFIEDAGEGVKRKNRFLNHLLARFSESLTDYSLWLYDQAVSKSKEQQETNTSEKLVEDKLNFLKKYPALSNDRGKAFNYNLKSWENENVSGLEKRIAGKLGITNFKRRKLAGTSYEGFHLVEHILLRPVAEDLSAIIEFLVPIYITKFSAVDGAHVKCHSENHGLQSGNVIIITGSNGYDGTHSVLEVLKDGFQIAAKYSGLGNVHKDDPKITLKPNFIRADVNTRILLLTKPIAEFLASSFNKTPTIKCVAPAHSLVAGDAIEIVGTEKFNGSYTVLNADFDSFEIAGVLEGAKKETGGRWMYQHQKKDPYSLQLTFVFPDRPEVESTNDRFQNVNFRTFIENTIREQTPVHLTVYIQWLKRDELAKFETAYESFLNQITNNPS